MRLNLKKYVFIIILFTTHIFASNLETLEKVSLQLKWKYQFQFAGFIAAYEKGFYSDAGLDVEFKELQEHTSTVADVLEGKSTFGISDSALIHDRLQGKKVKALMAVFQDSPFVLIGLKRDDLQSLEDLNGKKIAMHKGVDGISIQAMLKVKNISFNVHPPAFNYEKLQNGEVDLKSSYISNEPFIAKEKNIEIVTLSPQEHGFEGYGDILFTSEKTLQNKTEMVEKFYAASKKGWKYAFENSDEVIDIIYEKYNGLNKSKEALKYEANVLRELSGVNKDFGKLNFAKIKRIAGQFSLVKNMQYNMNNLEGFIYKPKIDKFKVCYSNDMRPYNFTYDNKAKGFGIDMLRLIENSSDFSFEYFGVYGGREGLKLLKEKKCDIVPTVVTNFNVTDFMQTSIPYGNEYLAIATSLKELYIEDLSLFKNKKIGINKKYRNTLAYIQKLYPGVNFIYRTQEEALTQLLNGQLDAYVDGYMFLMNEIKKNHYGVLKINNIIYKSKLDVGLGVHKDKTELLKRLNKVIENLDQTKKEEINYKWRHIEIKKEKDHTLAIQIALISLFTLVVLLTFYWRDQKLKKVILNLNKTLQDRVDEEVAQHKKKNEMIIQQTRLVQMGEIIHAIAHQWRQPLNRINGVLFVMDKTLHQDNIEKAIIQKSIKNIEENTAYMSNTIETFMNFFSPNKEKKAFIIKDAIENVLALLDVRLKNINIHLGIFETDAFIGYQKEFEEVILIIINNAIDNFNRREIKNPLLEIKALGIDEHIKVMVKDNGEGIKKDLMSKIFTPYFTTKTVKEGTGFGLYMAKNIVEGSMNGTIDVENNDNGVEFIITFPLKADNE